MREPIRVYAGLRSAGSADERAALAVRELERTGAFEREVLAVVTTTGTGWVDPNGASALEYLHGGDTAMAGLQYSYLPSWISFLVDRDEAAEAGTALYRQVHRRWSQLPAERRPRLLIFGESLGSFGAEAAFRGGDAEASLDKLVAGSDGALFTGPTASNHIWDQLTDAREAGSPVWRPVFGDGTAVRFANRPTDLERPDQAWRQPRVLYVHHPRTRWATRRWSRLAAAGMDRQPKGYDVPPGPGGSRSSPGSRRWPTWSPASAPPPATATITASTSPPAGPPWHPPTGGPPPTPPASSATSRPNRLGGGAQPAPADSSRTSRRPRRSTERAGC